MGSCYLHGSFFKKKTPSKYSEHVKRRRMRIIMKLRYTYAALSRGKGQSAENTLLLTLRRKKKPNRIRIVPKSTLNVYTYIRITYISYIPYICKKIKKIIIIMRSPRKAIDFFFISVTVANIQEWKNNIPIYLFMPGLTKFTELVFLLRSDFGWTVYINYRYRCFTERSSFLQPSQKKTIFILLIFHPPPQKKFTYVPMDTL